MSTAKLIYDVPGKNVDMYYATCFKAHDPIIYFEHNGKKHLVLNDLEIDRGKKEAKVDRYLSWSKYVRKIKKGDKQPEPADIVHAIFSERNIKKIIMPRDTSFDFVDSLRKYKYVIEAGPNPFYPERLRKTRDEVRYITDAQRIVFQTMRMVEDILVKSKIKGGCLTYRGATLTSEKVRQMIDVFLMERGFLVEETIVACGAHSIDPHDIGSGPLKPHQPIIVDIFPKSQRTFFYGDATRTFCKGSAPDALKRMYAVVKKGQEMGVKALRAGINGRKVHESIINFFDANGFKTGEKDGRMQGFFHSTGHGIGLELHEEPVRVGSYDCKVEDGFVMSVEPGLYYKGIGGVRIEDLVFVGKSGAKILASYPKRLEV